jgi:hypothetical protein
MHLQKIIKKKDAAALKEEGRKRNITSNTKK